MQLMTIGYEGLQLEQFFDILSSNQVQAIVDIREAPVSRKPGFSKSPLAKAATEHQLAYTHIRALGCPKEIRHLHRSDCDWASYTARFKAYLATQDAAILQLVDRIRQERCCLLCYEQNPNFCHRLFVAQRVAEIIGSNLVVTHLISQNQRQVVQSPLLSA